MIKKHLLLISSLLSLLLTACGGFPASQDEDISEPEEETTKEITEEPAEEDTSQKVSFYAVGDNLIHDEIFEYAQTGENTYDFKPIYENLGDPIETADLSFINQESIIGGDALGFAGYPAFNTPSAMIGNLVDLGFDIAIGSNNHTLDYGTRGIQNTLNYWEDYDDDILFTGAFDSQAARDEIPLIEMNDMTFSVLSYTYGTNGLRPDEPYQVNYFEPELITDDVNRAQEVSDFVLVSAHWGDEHALSPNQMQQEYAQLFADLEVDLVVGHHSHTIQPLEWVEGESGHETLVIYSLGNLLASTTSDINLLGGSVQLDFVSDNEEHSIEDVSFQPHVIHYENDVAGDISTRSNFKIHKLNNYTEELATEHALHNFEDNNIRVDYYQQIVNDVIDAEFLEE